LEPSTETLFDTLAVIHWAAARSRPRNATGRPAASATSAPNSPYFDRPLGEGLIHSDILADGLHRLPLLPTGLVHSSEVAVDNLA